MTQTRLRTATFAAAFLSVALLLAGCAAADNPDAQPTDPNETQTPDGTQPPVDESPEWSIDELCGYIMQAYPMLDGKQRIATEDYKLSHVFQGTQAPDCVYDISAAGELLPTHKALWVSASQRQFTELMGLLTRAQFMVNQQQDAPSDENFVAGEFARLIPSGTPGDILIEFLPEGETLAAITGERGLSGVVWIEITSTYDKDFDPGSLEDFEGSGSGEASDGTGD